jgi:hypothetical protein
MLALPACSAISPHQMTSQRPLSTAHEQLSTQPGGRQPPRSSCIAAALSNQCCTKHTRLARQHAGRTTSCPCNAQAAVNAHAGRTTSCPCNAQAAVNAHTCRTTSCPCNALAAVNAKGRARTASPSRCQSTQQQPACASSQTNDDKQLSSSIRVLCSHWEWEHTV